MTNIKKTSWLKNLATLTIIFSVILFGFCAFTQTVSAEESSPTNEGIAPYSTNDTYTYANGLEKTTMNVNANNSSIVQDYDTINFTIRSSEQVTNVVYIFTVTFKDKYGAVVATKKPEGKDSATYDFTVNSENSKCKTAIITGTITVNTTVYNVDISARFY